MTPQLPLALGNQRWREHRASYRRPDQPIPTRLYDVAEIAGDAEPKAFVQQHHYSSSYPAARFRFGLYRRGILAGVAVLSHPCQDRVLTNVFPGVATDSAELGRFVLLDSVEGNGETWFLGRIFELLRGQLRGVVSFSDPAERRSTDGRIVMPGHVGTIYQAHNAVYLGRGGRSSLRLLPDGTLLSPRLLSKMRTLDRGWRYGEALLRTHGATGRCGTDPVAWLMDWTHRLTRPFRHPGNHKYAWALDRRVRRVLPASLPYPKRGRP